MRRGGAFTAVASRILDFVSACAAAAAGVIMAAMTVVITWQIIGRFVLNDTPSWTEELTGTLIVYMTLIGAAAGVWSGGHIAIDLFTEKMPARLRRATNAGVFVLVAVFGAIMVFYGVKMMEVVRHWTNPTLQVTRAINYAAFPAAGALMCLFALARAFLGAQPERGPEALDDGGNDGGDA